MNPNSNLQKLGQRIKEVRIEKDMSQADVAAHANVSLPQISLIERGKTNMRISTFVGIIEALQISADDLLRADVPEVKGIYSQEVSSLLGDCTPKESEHILKIAKEVKEAMRSQPKE